MRVSPLAAFFLVLLRLAIGWHFFIEGMHKIHTHQIGVTATNQPWSSNGFFRAGYGPLAPFARTIVGISESKVDEDRIARIDQIIMWSLTIAGGLLLIGLFCRMACAALAFFLASVCLIVPALPGTPVPGATGYFVYVNFQTIEMIALFALAALPTGRWFGLDILLSRRSDRSILEK